MCISGIRLICYGRACPIECDKELLLVQCKNVLTLGNDGNRGDVGIREQFQQALGSPYVAWAAFLLVLYCFTIFTINMWIGYQATGRLFYLLLLISESLVLVLLVISRRTKDVPTFLSVLTTTTALFYFLLLGPRGMTIAAEPVPEIFQLVGIAVQIFAKLTLGRSFGLVAQNRGVVLKGPYLLVRHPMYFGYLITHVGFLLGSFSMHNLIVMGVLYLAQWFRMGEEEKVLQRDPAYKEYMERVRYRLVPGIL